ncbi:MAG: hypothetical protein Q7R64_00055 [bacterium]|nr:hypothetical protein [bacterium]
MLSWAQQRKFFFISGILLFFLAVFAVYGYVSFHSAPDCGNNAKDGNERGVDCGGSCTRVCRADVVPPIIHFARALEVDEGVWGAVAYVENKNAGAGARNAPYVFKLYDEENLLLYERHGTTYIPPRKIFAVFEGKMLSGVRTPTRATFEFTAEPLFFRIQEPELSVSTKDFLTDENGSSLRAVITNTSRVPVEGIDATALLFGADGNVSGASATTVKVLPGGASATLTFTWPRSFEEPSRIEVLSTVPGRN